MYFSFGGCFVFFGVAFDGDGYVLEWVLFFIGYKTAHGKWYCCRVDNDTVALVGFVEDAVGFFYYDYECISIVSSSSVSVFLKICFKSFVAFFLWVIPSLGFAILALKESTRLFVAANDAGVTP